MKLNLEISCLKSKLKKVFNDSTHPLVVSLHHDNKVFSRFVCWMS